MREGRRKQERKEREKEREDSPDTANLEVVVLYSTQAFKVLITFTSESQLQTHFRKGRNLASTNPDIY